MGNTTTGRVMLSGCQKISAILESGIIVNLSNAIIGINEFKVAMSYRLIS